MVRINKCQFITSCFNLTSYLYLHSVSRNSLPYEHRSTLTLHCFLFNVVECYYLLNQFCHVSVIITRNRISHVFRFIAWFNASGSTIIKTCNDNNTDTVVWLMDNHKDKDIWFMAKSIIYLKNQCWKISLTEQLQLCKCWYSMFKLDWHKEL